LARLGFILKTSLSRHFHPRMRIPFAVNRVGRLVTAGEVERGRKCDCTCPECGEPVVACQGQVKQAYFSHARGTECAKAYESSLHQAVKWLLDQRKALLLPDCFVRMHTRFMPDLFGYSDADWREAYAKPEHYDREHPETGVGHIPGRLVHFDEVRTEQNEGNVRPDVVGYVQNSPLFIEVAVTHFVDLDKERKLRARGVSVLELDFSDHAKSAWTWEELEKRLFEQTQGKTWLINRKAEQLARLDHAERTSRMAGYLAQREREQAKLERMALEQKKYEPTHLLRFDTPGYYSTCRVLLSRACISTNLENPSDTALKQRFRTKMMALGAVYSSQRRNYELPPSDERFLSLGKELYDLFASTGKGGLRAPDADRDRMERVFGDGIRRWA
jgi:hypothetical protein